MMKKLVTAVALLTAAVVPTVARSDDTSGAAAIKQIDSDCGAISLAVMALKPTHIVFAGGSWKVMNEGDYTVAERTHAGLIFVDAWKQGGNYAWIHSHTFTQNGNQKATQLCFRQSDGTLERARQATTVPDLNAASAQQAYFASDGSVIQKTSLFEVNDPAVTKKIADLPLL